MTESRREKFLQPEDGIVFVRPLEFHWDEWRQLYDSLDRRQENVHTLTAAVALWDMKANKWAQELSPNKREDVVDLLKAECDRLFMQAAPPEGEPSEDDRVDFRQSWYSALALLNIAKRHRFPAAMDADGAFTHLERFVIKKRPTWLP